MLILYYLLRSYLCDYSNGYIVVKELITDAGNNPINRRNKKLTFKKIDPFRLCISKINVTFVDNAEDLDNNMPIYNLLEYSDDYAMTSGSLKLWNYHKNKVNDSANEIAVNRTVNNNKITASKYF